MDPRVDWRISRIRSDKNSLYLYMQSDDDDDSVVVVVVVTLV